MEYKGLQLKYGFTKSISCVSRSLDNRRSVSERIQKSEEQHNKKP